MSRYPTEQCVDEPDEEFLCPICQDILDDPTTTPCGHVFCRRCISRVMRTDPTCPNCRRNLLPEQLSPASHAFRNLVRKIKMRCIYFQIDEPQNSCQKIVLLEDYQNHIENCEFVPCTCEYCNNGFTKSTIGNHKQNCDFRPIDCPNGCGQRIVSKDVQFHHFVFCAEGSRMCNMCAEEYKPMDFQTHRDSCKRSRILDLDLLLIGQPGVGKSGTGNTILGFKAFKSCASLTVTTTHCKKEVAELFSGRKISVVDTPGVFVMDYSEEENVANFITSIKQVIALSDRGYHALLLTLRYGSRVTSHDMIMFRHLKGVFGSTLEKHCIVIMTHGDLYEFDENVSDIPFIEWCITQSGYIKEIFEAVHYRVILFNKRGSDKEKAKQRQELFHMVDRLGGLRFNVAANQ